MKQISPSCIMFVILSFALVGVLALCSGCGDDKDDDGMPKTLEGAKDMIKNLQAEITRLNNRITDLENRTMMDKADLQLLVSQLRQENGDLKRADKLDQRVAITTQTNNSKFLYFSIFLNILSLMIILYMQLRYRRLFDECNHYITYTLHGRENGE